MSDPSSGAASHAQDAPCGVLSISQSHCEAQGEMQTQGKSCRYAMTIDALTDDTLLDIFHFCRNQEICHQLWRRKWEWDNLVHVCRRWRQIVFASPNRLRIRLECTHGTPVRTHLSCWPALPIVIEYGDKITPNDEDNIIAALGHPDRVSRIRLHITRSQLRKIATVMQQPFPVLRFLKLTSNDDTPVLSDGFLGGSAPWLQKLLLDNIPFPALPTLLSSAGHLVTIDLCDIPETGYISPEAMVDGLAALTSLRYLYIMFQSRTTRRPDQIRPPPVTRAVLPALRAFQFRGVSAYLEDLVARLDCPQLKDMKIWYINRPVGFRAVQLVEFINRLENPRLREFGWLDLRFFSCDDICLEVSHAYKDVMLCISFVGIEWEVSHVILLFDQFPAQLSNVRHLVIGYYRQEIGHNEWFQLVHPFTSVRTLHVVRQWGSNHPPALEDVTGEMETEVLPALELLCLQCPQIAFLAFFENIVTVRRFSGRPVTVAGTPSSPWEFDKKLKSYWSE